jgi:hypothetical protein
MIDLDKVAALCTVLFAGGLLVLLTYAATMNSVRDTTLAWREMGANSQAIAAQCVGVLEGLEAEQLSQLNR